ncbi:phosphotransferase family protein [uncultured Jatrophihabitans sp.]|uniref:phosphotransferase family protein n=1 Tax=uncultured Jatrophihabitans sp. TaxID=1610747 RepID=UPI0035CB6297
MSADPGPPADEVFHQTRYLDVALRALDEIFASAAPDERQAQRYQSVRRTLVRFAVDRGPEPGRDELGVTWPHPPAAQLSDPELAAAAADEAALLDAAIGRADARLAAPVGSSGAATNAALDAPTIEKALRRAGFPDAQVRAAQLVFGGRSKETVLLEADATGLPRELVLRRDLAMSSLGTTVTDEYPLLQLLHHAGVRVPEPYLLVDDPELLGAPFLLLERRTGTAGGGILGTTSTPARLRATARALASVHGVPAEDARAAMGGGAGSNGDGLRRELDGLYGEWRRLNRGDSLTVEAAFRWLRAHVPDDAGRQVLVHADFSFHNLLFDGAELTAILDWELAHVGDPAEDFCYLRSTAEATVGWPAFLADYRDAGGGDVPLPSVRFFELRATVRLIVQLLRSRDHFEHGRIDDPIKADGSMYWLPRVAQRLAREVAEALAG